MLWGGAGGGLDKFVANNHLDAIAFGGAVDKRRGPYTMALLPL